MVAARRQLEAMKSGNGSDGPLTSTNLLFEQIKLKIVEAEAQIAAYKGRLGEAEKDLARLEDIAKQAPGVAAEYQNLDRDYNIIRKNYEELLARREATRLAEAADAKADQMQIRVVDPPQASVLPVAPKRALLYAGVFFAGLGMGGGGDLSLRADRSQLRQRAGARSARISGDRQHLADQRTGDRTQIPTASAGHVSAAVPVRWCSCSCC